MLWPWPSVHLGQLAPTIQGGGGIRWQVKFAVVNFAVGNFAKTPGFRVVNFTDTSRNVVVQRALLAW